MDGAMHHVPEAANIARDHFVPTPDWLASAPEVSDNPADEPTKDHAHAILATHAMNHSISEPTLAAAYDAYHNAKNSNALRQSLSLIALPAETVGALLRAKRVTDPVQTPVDKVASALTAMAQIPTSVLDLAEKLPHVAKALIDAATKE
jgi:hypothetical protein